MLSPRWLDWIVLAQQGGEGTEAAPGGGALQILVPLIAIFAIFYFLIIRPESKRRRERESKVKALRKGDHVLTTGGIYGIVRKTDDRDVELEVDKEKKVRMRFAKSAILDVLASEAAARESGAASAEPESEKEEGVKP